MCNLLTVTEAETLATMLDSASYKMAHVRTESGTYAWNSTDMREASAEMFAMFYHIAPMGVYI